MTDSPKPRNTRPRKPVYVSFVQGDQILAKKYTLSAAKKAGIFDPLGYAFLDDGMPDSLIDHIVCPNCGATQKDFEQSGRLGCVECFQHFSEPLQTLIERIHKGNRHCGKVPQTYAKHLNFLNQLEASREQLKQAVAQENFEEAARLRDAVRKLEKKVKTNPSR